jgi:Rab-like protein 2
MSAEAKKEAKPATTSGTANATTAQTGTGNTKSDDKPADLKIILLGDSAVGKSKLVERFLMNDYVPRQLSTFALTVFRHTATIDEKKVVVDFWDTAGQERFNSMHPSYYYRAHACILVFDVTRKVTYTNLSEWFKELQQYREGIPTLVVANKIDVDMNVTKKQFAFAVKNQLQFFFCSAAEGTNVVKAFTDAIRSGLAYKNSPACDFTEEVLREIDYFDAKEVEKLEKERLEKEKAGQDKDKAPAKTSTPATSTQSKDSSTTAKPTGQKQ